MVAQPAHTIHSGPDGWSPQCSTISSTQYIARAAGSMNHLVTDIGLLLQRLAMHHSVVASIRSGVCDCTWARGDGYRIPISGTALRCTIFPPLDPVLGFLLFVFYPTRPPSSNPSTRWTGQQLNPNLGFYQHTIFASPRLLLTIPMAR